MNNDNTPTVSYKDTPPDFSPCFVSECPKRAECIRYAVGQTFPPGPRMGICVFPQSLQDGECSYFYPLRTIREAWGFDPLFYDVKARDETPLRQSIERYVGSRSAYFRYNHGIRTLTPEQHRAAGRHPAVIRRARVRHIGATLRKLPRDDRLPRGLKQVFHSHTPGILKVACPAYYNVPSFDMSRSTA